ncbi:hypothetical protein [Hyphomicrobium sp.]|uniref:hypothetical protein n=1 Tax=Hyphomicrobium sp. TaxID=82 RepID=UPI001D292EB6|nr:hypothetical protein [Hyphomicrobium sp.]MBY0562372.1 hypothetical protein [Hyphomicrobium sp.]
MSIIARLKQFFENKKQSYEASAAMIACIVAAAGFALAAGTMGLATYVGPILSCVIFGGAFLLLAFIFWLIGRSKTNVANHELETAKQTASASVSAASTAIKAVTSKPAKSLSTLDTIAAATLLAFLLYLAGRKTPPSVEDRRTLPLS